MTSNFGAPALETENVLCKLTKKLTRRRMVIAGGVGLAGLATTIAAERVQANTQKPLTSATDKANPKGRFAGRVVLITGATSGIGEATARAFAKEGAIVHFCGRRENLGNQVAQSIQQVGGKVTYQPADVRVEKDVKAFVDKCVQLYGHIDIAFNNAGIVSPKAAPIVEQSLEDWMDVMLTNPTGYFLSMKHEIPYLLRNQPWGAFGTRGVIVNNASVSGHIGFPNIALYSASKHAILGLTKCAALEYGAQGLRINSISPGAVDTPMRRRAYAAQGIPDNQPLPPPPDIVSRANTPQEMAEVVMLLAANETSSILGTDIDVTSGMLTGFIPPVAVSSLPSRY